MTSTFGAFRTFGAAGGLAWDHLVGEPATAWHPLVFFGQFMRRVEDVNYDDTKVAGLRHVLVGLVVGLGAGAVMRSTTVATGLAVGRRALHEAARDVATALASGDLDEARRLLPTLVGRDPLGLDAEEISRAVVESVAENTVDAVVAPVLFAVIAGAPGVLAYRALNTLDAMVGHHSVRYERYGWASARLDDVANWLPARCTAVLVGIVRPRSVCGVTDAVLSQAPLHPSPNAGVAEAAFAGAMGVRVGGRSVYGSRVEDRPQLGRGRACRPGDIDEAIRLSNAVTSALALSLLVVGAWSWWRR